MIWRLVLHRVILWFVAVILLLPVTAYATAKKLKRLPLGLDKIFGCEEDGWNGNGVDPDNPRQFWIPGRWHKIHENAKGEPLGTQGWWPDYKKWNWSKMGFFSRWFASYRWLLRNLCWNLRLIYNEWFSASIDYRDIKLTLFDINRDTGEVKARWRSLGKEYWFRRKRIGKCLFDLGWEFYPYVFDQKDPLYKRIREHGYTREYKYKTRSIPSIRVRWDD